MADIPIENRQQKLTSEELIAQAYAAIASYGVHGELPAPTGKPVAVNSNPSAAGIDSGGVSGANRKASSGYAPTSSARSVPSPSQQAKAKTSAGPKPLPAQTPYQPPYQQSSRESRSSSPFQPPPPSGAPISPTTRPIQPSRNSMTTGAPAASRPASISGSGNTRPAQRQQPQKKTGWGTMIFWLFIILFFLLGLPYLVSD